MFLLLLNWNFVLLNIKVLFIEIDLLLAKYLSILNGVYCVWNFYYFGRYDVVVKWFSSICSSIQFRKYATSTYTPGVVVWHPIPHATIPLRQCEQRIDYKQIYLLYKKKITRNLPACVYRPGVLAIGQTRGLPPSPRTRVHSLFFITFEINLNLRFYFKTHPCTCLYQVHLLTMK